MSSKSLLYLLCSNEELKSGYRRKLQKKNIQLKVFSSVHALFEAKVETKRGILAIDLDLLGPNLNTRLEKIGTQFSGCEMIALSSQDSSQLATQCLRCGFSDYLLKPVTPEELVWTIEKCQERMLLSQQLPAQSSLLTNLNRISSSSNPMTIRVLSLDYLCRYFEGKAAFWLSFSEQKSRRCELLSEFPSHGLGMQAERVMKTAKGLAKPEIRVGNKNKLRKVYLPLPKLTARQEAIVITDIEEKVSSKKITTAISFLQHSYNHLVNSQKIFKLKQESFVDDLTGLYNARYLKYALNHSFVSASQNQTPFSLLFIDVDHFKLINDKHGHIVGSEFLVAIGKTIKNKVRGKDSVFRYGGDEFVVILKDTNLSDAKDVGERIRRHIEARTFNIQGHPITTTVSIGIATYPDHATEKNALLKMADHAMYEAKRDNKNAVYLASPEKIAPLTSEPSIKEIDN